MSEFYPRLYTVSALTREIRILLEDGFPLVWVSGEVSNLRQPLSGHLYFTLKDAEAQLRAVLFKGNLPGLKTRPGEGQKLICRGRLSVYETRGEYQLLVDYLEPLGFGALAQAFEELKARLAAAGLFAPEHKKPLPFLPRRLGLITSPSGAALRDFLQVLHRRFPHVEVLIYPVRVQGEGAAEEIAVAIAALNLRKDLDVLILTRGGGSLEDLWAFNEECVARAIYASRLPIIAAVGHEIDFTIADFVADLRAPTPSAAAELVVPRREELHAQVQTLALRLARQGRLLLATRRERLTLMSRRLADPRRRLAPLRQRLDERAEHLVRLLRTRLGGQRQVLNLHATRLALTSPRPAVQNRRQHLQQLARRLRQTLPQRLAELRRRLGHGRDRLQSLSPQAVLERGYAVVTTRPDGRLIRQASQVQAGDGLAVRLARGSLDCTVETVSPN